MNISRNLFVRLEVVFLILLITIIPIGYILSNTTDRGHQLVDDTEGYRLYIEAVQWEYRVYDLNDLNMTVEEFREEDYEFKSMHVMQHRFHVETGKDLNVYLTSRDVRHSIIFEKIDLYLEAERPEVGEEFGPVAEGSSSLPSDDEILVGKAHFDVGLKTDDMKITIYVGNPTLWINIILSSIAGLMIAFFIYYTYNLYHGTNIFAKSEHDDTY